MVFLLKVLLFAGLVHAKETRIKIAVIDTGIKVDEELKPFMCESGHKSFCNKNICDIDGHGTMIAKLIVDGLDSKKYCLLNLKWNKGDATGSSPSIYYLKALIQAAIENVSYVNLSLSGATFFDEEYRLIKLMLHNNTTVVVAAGNDKKDLSKDCSAYPACLPIKHRNFRVVSNTYLGNPICSSNYGGPTTDTEIGMYGAHCGTSFSAPKILNKIIKNRDF